MKKRILGTGLAIAMMGVGLFSYKFISDNQYGAPDLANGKVKFNTNCAVCHGDRGLGDGLAAASLTISPDNIYEEVSNPFGLKSELISSVLDGDNGQGGLMPAFKTTLTEKDVDDILEYVRHANTH
ncbi:cytochrome C [Photobacterium jeanii]|uniref:Cytochrome C n=1 Tax=Photobacterium jeanii TaxID=858640 RepID=A0A178K2D7_9GAMM|nr:cytochrome c [Photobacterium jeanii]OAN11478.1 cytochrome C [Photobacterium jeanii]PST90997.1 cytochrome c [Photobacterium jeanii]